MLVEGKSSGVRHQLSHVLTVWLWVTLLNLYQVMVPSHLWCGVVWMNCYNASKIISVCVAHNKSSTNIVSYYIAIVAIVVVGITPPVGPGIPVMPRWRWVEIFNEWMNEQVMNKEINNRRIVTRQYIINYGFSEFWSKSFSFSLISLQKNMLIFKSISVLYYSGISNILLEQKNF